MRVQHLKESIDDLLQQKYLLRSALQALYDDCADYIKTNNLYRKDGKSAIWNQVMQEAKRALEKTTFADLKD